jgi:hypothetical protein
MTFKKRRNKDKKKFWTNEIKKVNELSAQEKKEKN